MIVNRELEEIKAALPAFMNLLCEGGRMAVISFHSLEDRLVKRFLAREARGDDFPPDFPIRSSELSPRIKKIGKAQKPTASEVDTNPRSRSARLRVAEKIGQARA